MCLVPTMMLLLMMHSISASSAVAARYMLSILLDPAQMERGKALAAHPQALTWSCECLH